MVAPEPCLSADPIIPRTTTRRMEGRARDNRIRHGASTRGKLVTGDDGEVRAAAAIDEGGLGRR